MSWARDLICFGIEPDLEENVSLVQLQFASLAGKDLGADMVVSSLVKALHYLVISVARSYEGQSKKPIRIVGPSDESGRPNQRAHHEGVPPSVCASGSDHIDHRSYIHA